MDNKYSSYQKIRYNRTYRTLGKMSVWRVVLGIALLVLVLLMSGAVSQFFASNGRFHTAKALMIAPQWMEKYKPETKAYIEAGVAYSNGDYEKAYEAFDSLGDSISAAPAMKSVCAVRLAQQRLDTGDYEGAYSAISSALFELMPADEADAYRDVCVALAEYYSTKTDAASKDRAAAVAAMLSAAQE